MRERRRVHRLIRGAIRFVERSRSWTFLFDRFHGDPKRCLRFGLQTGIVGGINRSRRIVALDCRHDVISTLLHECFHARYPGLQEKEIRRLEALCDRHITRRQATRLLKALARRLS